MVIGVILGLNIQNGNYRDYRGYIRVILTLFWDNGKENGNCYLGFRV